MDIIDGVSKQYLSNDFFNHKHFVNLLPLRISFEINSQTISFVKDIVNWDLYFTFYLMKQSYLKLFESPEVVSTQ